MGNKVVGGWLIPLVRVVGVVFWPVHPKEGVGSWASHIDRFKIRCSLHKVAIVLSISPSLVM